MARLVAYYEKRLGGDGGALSVKLAELVNLDRPINSNYCAVALRNEYYKLLKLRNFRLATVAEFDENTPAKNDDLDLKIDIKKALGQLSQKEKTSVFLRFYCGYSVAEIAKINGVSRQAENKRLKKALDKLKTLL